MEVDNNAEKEASEVLHSLLSVERRGMDSKENIIVSIPNMNTSNGSEYGNEQAQWHTPVLGQHSVFTLADPQVLQTGEYSQQGQQVIWHGHTIQIENSDGMTNETAILHDIYPIVTLHDNNNSERSDQSKDDMDIKERKPLIQRKIKSKPKKKVVDESEDLEDKNKLEDNPMQVKAKMKKGCDCKVSCYKGLIPENVYKHRLNIAELTKSEHDMYLMGVTMACLANPLETTRHKARRRLRAQYVYQGRRVCLEAFLYLENVTHYQLKRIRHHVITHGVAPRVHGNMGKKPYNTFSLDIYKHATEFLKEYLFRNTGGNKDLSKTIVVHGDSRKTLYDAYREYGEMLDPNIKLMGYSTFRHFMKEQFPNVKFGGKKPEERKEVHFPFKSGKCMTYDKNKDPMRMEAKEEDSKKDAKSKEIAQEAEAKQHHQQQQQQVSQQHQQQVEQQQQQQNVQQQVVIQQQQTLQVGQHQMMTVQTVGDDASGQQMEISPQVIPLVVQPQQTYIVTPLSHMQTTVNGAWYRGH